MVLPGHISGGYIAARAVLFLTHAVFTPAQTAILLTIGTLAGEGPDIDLIALYLIHRKKTPANEKKNKDHRLYITHAPVVWLILSLVIAGIGYLNGSPFTQTAGWMVLAGSWSHFLFDSIEYGIRWLWPFSDKRYSMRKEPAHQAISDEDSFISYNVKFVTGPYLRWVTCYVEIAVTLAAIWVAFH